MAIRGVSMTEEKRKEDILKQYEELPKGIVKYIDFLIAKINKLVAENKRKRVQIPQWHDLRKDPNDLPKVTKEYITNIGVMTFDRLKDRHLWTTPICDACDYYEEVTDDVIAWCEIPQFKE